MLFETKLAGIDTFRCLEYRLQVLNKVGWFFIDKCEVAGISFLANRIRDLFCFDRRSLNSLFWWNQNSLNGSVNWVVAV